MKSAKHERVLVFGPTFSIHLYRWCRFLWLAGFCVDTVCERNAPGGFDYSQFGKVIYLPEDPHYIFLGAARRAERCARGLLRRLSLKLFLRRYSALNYHWLADYGKWGSMVRVRGRKHVITCWGSDVNEIYLGLGPRDKEMVDCILRKCTAVTYNATSIRDTLLGSCTGLQAEKIRQIDWGIDQNLFRPESRQVREEIRRNYGLPPNARTILSPRLANPAYQNLGIIEWFKASSLGTDWYLIMRIPPFNRDTSYVRQMKQSGKSYPRIIFDERDIIYEELPNLYALADFCVHFPTNDGIAASILEGIGCGVQTILNRNVASHIELSGFYDLILCDLYGLSTEYLLDRLRRSEEIGARNRAILEARHSEKVSILRVKEVFGAGAVQAQVDRIAHY